MYSKIVGLCAGLLLLLAAVTGTLHYLRGTQHLTALACERLEAIAITAAAALDGDAHLEVNNCLDRECPNYLKLAAYLRRVQRDNQLSSELYTVALTDQGAAYIVRPRKAADIGHRRDTRPEMLRVFETGESAVTQVYRDPRGSWVSAYAPVKDSKGKTVALLEADYRAEDLAAMLFSSTRELALVSLAGLLGTLVLAGRLARRLSEPLRALTEAVDASARGDDRYPVPRGGCPEIVVLAERFVRMREEVRKAHTQERLAVVGRMAGTMVHDLRGPLMVVGGLTEMIVTEDCASERTALGDKVLQQVARIEAMAKDVLDYSRGDVRMEPRPFEAGALVAETMSELVAFARKKDVTLRPELAWRGEVWGDPEKVRRLLYNLVKNAIEVTPASGRVTVRLEAGPTAWRLQVRDEGPGIPPEVAGRLFQPFATHGKKGGTGLGLAMVKTVAEAHGGTVAARNVEGAGASFEVEIPLDCRSGRKPAAPARAVPAPGLAMRVAQV